jgi:hypothetical protein
MIFDLHSDSCLTLETELDALPGQAGIMYPEPDPSWSIGGIEIDFNAIPVVPTHYTICFGPGTTTPGWTLRGQDDPPVSRYHWVTIDTQRRVSSVYAQKFEVKETHRCRELSLWASGYRAPDDTLVIRAFEVFGTLVEPSRRTRRQSRPLRLLDAAAGHRRSAIL